MHKNTKTVAETLPHLFLQPWYFYSWLNLIRCHIQTETLTFSVVLLRHIKKTCFTRKIDKLFTAGSNKKILWRKCVIQLNMQVEVYSSLRRKKRLAQGKNCPGNTSKINIIPNYLLHFKKNQNNTPKHTHTFVRNETIKNK